MSLYPPSSPHAKFPNGLISFSDDFLLFPSASFEKKDFLKNNWFVFETMKCWRLDTHSIEVMYYSQLIFHLYKLRVLNYSSSHLTFVLFPHILIWNLSRCEAEAARIFMIKNKNQLLIQLIFKNCALHEIASGCKLRVKISIMKSPNWVKAKQPSWKHLFNVYTIPFPPGKHKKWKKFYFRE